MEKKKRLSVQGVTVTNTNDDVYVDMQFRCLSGREGGCALHQRSRVARFLRPIFEGQNGSLDIAQGGFACDLGRRVDKSTADAPQGCTSRPSLLLDRRRLNDAVTVVQHRNGNTTFIFK